MTAPPDWLPPGFVWGSASSSLQCEGAAPRSDWGGWEAAGHVPTSGDGNGFATRYGEDFALLAAHGFGAHRLTLEWARLEPVQAGRLDAGEVERYRTILRAAADAGVDVWASLVHTTLPGWFSEDERGFLDERMARRVWPAHVDRIGEAFGDLVAGWIPIHEPVRHALDAWLNGMLPPGRRDADDASQGLRLLQAADVEAARLLRGGGVPVACCQWLPPVYAAGDTPEARLAAGDAEGLIWRSWSLDPDRLDTWDLVGVSVGHGVGVGPDGTFHPWPAGAEPGPLGWAPWPEAVAESIERAADRLPGRDLLLLTGAVDSDDERRAETVRGLAAGLRDAVTGGAPVRGCLWWSGVDGYEGRAGFTARSGMFDRERVPAPALEAVAG